MTALIPDIPHRTAEGVKLATWEWEGDRPGFLLVHGLASNARLWDGVARGLNQRSHHVITLDLRGHGLSSKPDKGFDFATMTTDLAGLIEARMKAPVITAGQSFGGNLVIELAARYPDLVSGVVCVDGGFVDLRAAWPEWSEAVAVLTPPTLEDVRSEALQSRAELLYPGWPEEAITAQMANLEVLADGRVVRRLALANHLQILRAMWEQSPTMVAQKVEAPVLVLAANSGPAPHRRQVEQFAAALQDGRVEWIDGHHDLHAQKPDRVVGLIVDALAEGFLR